MTTLAFWLRVLNVYPEEWPLVKRLYLIQFFQGVGVAFFFTSVFARFLKKFPITELTWVMILSAVLLWIAGLIYTRLEHAIKFSRFNMLIIIFMTVSMILIWIANYSISADWLYYLVLAWFDVLYFLSNMEFWGVAALLFDLRQSKRLFGVISAGDIPAKFIGYTLALLFVPYTGTQNLILIGSFCMLCSLPFFLNIRRTGKLEFDHGNHGGQHSATPPHKIRRLVVNIATNTYIRRIAFISLISIACVIVVNYGFYGEVKKAYHDDVALASFIAFFYAGLRIVAFITKLVFTSRLNSLLGVRQALFITPVVMLLIVMLIVVVDLYAPGDKLVFYLFGTCAIVLDVLRASFNSPVLLTLMQPLSTHDRLRAHNIVKGIMDPFASFLTGIFLLIILYIHGKVELLLLCYCLLILVALWIVGVILVNRQYLHMLIRTIGSRYFGNVEFDLNNDAVLNHIRKKLATASEPEVISILRLLSNKPGHVADELILGLLDHSSQPVKLEAIRLLRARRTDNAKEKLLQLLNSEVSIPVRIEIVKTLSKISKDQDEVSGYLLDANEDIHKGAVTGMLANDNEEIKQMATAEINRLLYSTNNEEKINAIAILSEVSDEYDFPGHARLIRDNDPEIRELAIKAVGKASNVQTLSALFEEISLNEKNVMAAFYNAGTNAIPVIFTHITTNEISENLQEKLIVVCGRIGGEEAIKALLDLLKLFPLHTAIIIKSLYKCRYTTNADTQKQFEAIARAYVISGVELLYMQQGLQQTSKEHRILSGTLTEEIHEIREVLLCLFGCMYDRDKINQAKYGLNTNHKESVANAMEIIEITVKKEIGKNFNTMFETTSLEQRCMALRSLLPMKQFNELKNIMTMILSEKPVRYYSWTKACTMYISKKYLHSLDNKLYEKYTTSESHLLRETALFATSVA